MRVYLIEDIYENQMDTIEERLRSMELQGPIDGIYYLPIPEDKLNDEQKEHLPECGPFFMALETIRIVGAEQADCSMKLELLVRARNIIRCSCVSYADADLRAYMMEYIDNLLADLDITV